MQVPSRRAFVVAGAAAFVGAPGRTFAQAVVPIRVIAFFSTTTLPIWAAAERGFFAREGIELVLRAAGGSAEAFVRLSNGEVDLATAAVDNVVAYVEGAGDAALPGRSDFVAVAGTDGGSLRLYARPEIATYADLRRKTLAVDALGSGYSLLLRQMLENRGLHPVDYRFEAVGGSTQRLRVLQSGPEYAAALLSVPYDLEARRAGLRLLGTGRDGAAAYQASVTVARRSWLATNEELAVRYIRAVLAGLDWLYDPRNQTAAIALLGERLKIAADVAAEVFPSVIDPSDGLFRDGRISLAGMRTVLALRNRYGTPKMNLTDARKYYDERYYLAATRGRR